MENFQDLDIFMQVDWKNLWQFVLNFLKKKS